MKRSLFAAFFVRLFLGLAVIGLVLWFAPKPWLAAGVTLFSAGLLSWWCSRTVAGELSSLTVAVHARGSGVLEGTFPQEFEPHFAVVHDTLSRLKQEHASMAEVRHELETILDSMADAVVAVDSSARIQWTNAAMRRLIHTPPDDESTRVGHLLMHVVHDPEVLACLDTALTSRKECEGRATAVLPGRIYEVQTTPVPNGGAVAVLHDITQLEQLERVKRDLVANVSHELRTPLTSITGYVETLLDEATASSMGHEFLTIILKNARRMNSLVEDLLVLARVESGAQALRPRRVQPSMLVRETLEAVAGSLRESFAQVEIGPVADVTVFADVDGVIRVLTNLIENALKYGSSPFGEKVILSVQEDREMQGMVRFSVQDFGAGIAPEHLPRLFERFYRVDKARSRESGGTGLGLAIARRLTEAQGGTIWCVSEPNHGSTFSFTLPLVEAAEVNAYPARV